MTTKRRVPEIRFKGFEGEWEAKELAELAEIKTGYPFNSSDFNPNGKFLVITNGNIQSDYPFVVNSIGNKIDINSGDNLERYKLLENDILVTMDGTVGRTAKVREMNQVLAQRVGRLVAINDPEFLYQYLNTGQFSKEMELLSHGGTIKHISLSEISHYRSSIPASINEQSQIGTFFQKLDSLITLQQRTYDKLTTVKKAMLEKMFPKEGADVPEIRFKGFTEKWERRTLGALYSERNQRGNDSLQILSVSIHHGVSSGELDSDTLGKQVRRSEDKSLYKHVYSGDLVLNMMRAWQGAIGVVKAEGMVSPAYITAIPNEHVFPLFMDCCMRRSQIISQMDNLSYGVTDFRKRLYWDSFTRVLCHIPSVSEQSKITDFFQNLDSLLTLQQRKLDKLKNIKKACLEKMFV